MSPRRHVVEPSDVPQERIGVLDVARGIAILGTLATNIWIFTDPGGIIGYLQRPLPSLTGGLEQAVQTIARQLANGKFLGMLTLMFGVGLELQRRSARRRGRPWPGRYPWRASLLFLDGLLHYLLVVEFDILMGYAVTGMVVAAVLATSPRSQRIWLWTAASLHMLLLSALTVALLLWGTGGDPSRADAVTLYTDGSWLEQVGQRLEWFPLYRAEAVFILPLSVAMFLAGSQLMRAGLFEQRGRALRRRMMAIGLGLALPLDLAIGSLGGAAGLVFARYATAPLVAARAARRRSVPGRGATLARVPCGAGSPRWAVQRCRATCCRTSSAARCATAGALAWRPGWVTCAPGGPSCCTPRFARW